MMYVLHGDVTSLGGGGFTAVNVYVVTLENL